jgi:hypothetical protein
VSQIIIVDRTQYDESEIEEGMSWKEMRKFLRKQVKSLQLATIENFREIIYGKRPFSSGLIYRCRINSWREAHSIR